MGTWRHEEVPTVYLDYLSSLVCVDTSHSLTQIPILTEYIKYLLFEHYSRSGGSSLSSSSTNGLRSSIDEKVEAGFKLDADELFLLMRNKSQSMCITILVSISSAETTN